MARGKRLKIGAYPKATVTVPARRSLRLQAKNGNGNKNIPILANVEEPAAPVVNDLANTGNPCNSQWTLFSIWNPSWDDLLIKCKTDRMAMEYEQFRELIVSTVDHVTQAQFPEVFRDCDAFKLLHIGNVEKRDGQVSSFTGDVCEFLPGSKTADRSKLNLNTAVPGFPNLLNSLIDQDDFIICFMSLAESNVASTSTSIFPEKNLIYMIHVTARHLSKHKYLQDATIKLLTRCPVQIKVLQYTSRSANKSVRALDLLTRPFDLEVQIEKEKAMDIPWSEVLTHLDDLDVTLSLDDIRTVFPSKSASARNKYRRNTQNILKEKPENKTLVPPRFTNFKDLKFKGGKAVNLLCQIVSLKKSTDSNSWQIDIKDSKGTTPPPRFQQKHHNFNERNVLTVTLTNAKKLIERGTLRELHEFRGTRHFFVFQKVKVPWRRSLLRWRCQLEMDGESCEIYRMVLHEAKPGVRSSEIMETGDENKIV